jgi:capsular polysaccharide biosynthesis protein
MAVWRWLWVVVLCTGVGGASALIFTMELAPRYRATASLLINQALLDGSITYDSLLATERLAKIYSRMLLTPRVQNVAAKNLELNETQAELAKRITVNAIPNTPIIEVSADDQNPQRAALIANEIAKVFVQQFREREGERYAQAQEQLTAELSRLDAEIGRLESELESIRTGTSPTVSGATLEQAVAEQRSKRSALLNSVTQIQIGKTQQFHGILLLEPAEIPVARSNFRPLLNTAVGAFAGMMAALLAVFAMVFFRQQTLLAKPPAA